MVWLSTGQSQPDRGPGSVRVGGLQRPRHPGLVHHSPTEVQVRKIQKNLKLICILNVKLG